MERLSSVGERRSESCIWGEASPHHLCMLEEGAEACPVCLMEVALLHKVLQLVLRCRRERGCGIRGSVLAQYQSSTIHEVRCIAGIGSGHR